MGFVTRFHLPGDSQFNKIHEGDLKERGKGEGNGKDSRLIKIETHVR